MKMCKPISARKQINLNMIWLIFDIKNSFIKLNFDNDLSKIGMATQHLFCFYLIVFISNK